MKKTIFLIIAACYLGGASGAYAAQEIFLQIAGVKGESVARGQEGAIDVLAWSWGSSRSGTREIAAKVAVGDLSMTKWVDASTPHLLRALSTGKYFKGAKLIVRKVGRLGPVEFMVIDLMGVLVTSHSIGGGGGEDRATENITLSFAEYRYTYLPSKPDGSSAAPIIFGFNIAENREK